MLTEKKEVTEKADWTLNVCFTTKAEIIRLKLHPRETVDDVINRLITMYKAIKPQ